ncbi:hypothetical protein [Kibdelosporangium aridum]|uniref:Uncharacterized protein n=1 Tax=Kibdelosporangium aridum TaxID=2030 RepID=A0A1Y5YA09_KIBAR|nr:hypothetical protein [Kibdelosporangium aridum]SMD26700.1 hypothetical protein SAMN05661093_10284 [Kibdelosporangium aridum]
MGMLKVGQARPVLAIRSSALRGGLLLLRVWFADWIFRWYSALRGMRLRRTEFGFGLGVGAVGWFHRDQGFVVPFHALVFTVIQLGVSGRGGLRATVGLDKVLL